MSRKLVLPIMVLMLISINSPTVTGVETNQNPNNQVYVETLTLEYVDSNANDLIDYIRLSFTYYIDSMYNVHFWLSLRDLDYNYYDNEIYSGGWEEYNVQSGNHTGSFNIQAEALHVSQYIGNLSIHMWADYSTVNSGSSFYNGEIGQILNFNYTDYEISRLNFHKETLNYEFNLYNGTILTSVEGLDESCNCIDYVKVYLGYSLAARGYLDLSLKLYLETEYNHYDLGESYIDGIDQFSGEYTAVFYVAVQHYYNSNLNGTLKFRVSGNYNNYNDNTYLHFGGLFLDINETINSQMFVGVPFLLSTSDYYIQQIDDDNNGLIDFLDYTLTINSTRDSIARFWVYMEYTDVFGEYHRVLYFEIDDVQIMQGIHNVTLRVPGGQIQASGYVGDVQTSINGESYRIINGNRVVQWVEGIYFDYSVNSNEYDYPPVRILSLTIQGQYNPGSEQNGFDYVLVTLEFEVEYRMLVDMWFSMYTLGYGIYFFGGGLYDYYNAGVHTEEWIFDGDGLYDTYYSGDAILEIYNHIEYNTGSWEYFEKREIRSFNYQDYNPDGRYDPNAGQTTSSRTSNSNGNSDGSESSTLPTLPLPGFEFTLLGISITSLIVLNQRRRKF